MKLTLLTWDKGHMQMMLSIYPIALCKGHTPTALMGDVFPLVTNNTEVVQC